MGKVSNKTTVNLTFQRTKEIILQILYQTGKGKKMSPLTKDDNEKILRAADGEHARHAQGPGLNSPPCASV
jgi:hypothetical protein